jgi:hypothetical protein
MSDSHNIPRTSLNKPVANQGFVDANLAAQNVGQQQPGGLLHPINEAENFIHKEEMLHGGQYHGQQLLTSQPYLSGQQFISGQPIVAGQQIISGQPISTSQPIFGTQQYLGGQQHLEGHQYSTGQVLQGSTSYSQGVHQNVTHQSSIASANLPSKIITIEETPAIITTVTTSEAPVQVETKTNLIQETIQSTRQEAIVQPVVQPVVQMQEQVVGMQPVIGKVPVTTGYVETGYVQNTGLTGGSKIISTNTTSFPVGFTETYSTSLPVSQGFVSTTPLISNMSQPINTGLHTTHPAPVVHEKKKHGFFHRKHKDTSAENKYV